MSKDFDKKYDRFNKAEEAAETALRNMQDAINLVRWKADRHGFGATYSRALEQLAAKIEKDAEKLCDRKF